VGAVTSIRPRIFEEVHVIEEDGTEAYAFTREVDPRMYYIGPDLRDAAWLKKVYHVARGIAGWELP